MNDLGTKGAALIFVVLIMAGSLGMFALMQIIEFNNPDPNVHTDKYQFSGSLYGEPCSGMGTSDYKEESSREYVYYLEYTVESASHRENLSTGMIFDLHGDMVSDLYEYKGDDTIDGKAVKVWYQENKGVDYTYYVAEHCTVLKMLIQCSDYNLTGIIVQESS